MTEQQAAADGMEPPTDEDCMPDFSDVPPEQMGLRVYHMVNEGEPATPGLYPHESDA